MTIRKHIYTSVCNGLLVTYMYLNDCIFIRDDEDLFLNRITFSFSAILYTLERYITRRKHCWYIVGAIATIDF